MFEQNQASNEFLFHNRKVFSEQLGFLIIFFRGNSHIESSHSLRQNDAKFQTHHPVPFLSKCQICRKSMFITSDIKLVEEF